MQDSHFSFQTYKQYKNQVLSLYKDLTTLIELKINITLYEYINKLMENLQKDEFIIAVAGEVKAGKSTFINSLLKEEILPSDVLQATSSLIEIFYSPKPFLKITYASGRKETYEEESKTLFKDILKRVASIPEEYRDIPTSLIDQYLLDFKEKPEINEEFIKYLEEKSGMDNLAAKRDKLIQYTNFISLDKIPLRIELGYPFYWKFEELRIVDMPGVNAIGGVQDISFSFIERANAVLFIHPIKPVESESFKRFVQSIITNKSRENLFLILTHAAVFYEEKDRLLEEAKRIYSSIIPQDRIFAVDSILKLIYEDLEKGKTPQEIKAEPHKRKWYIFFKEMAEELNLDIKEAFLKFSGFQDLSKQLENFIMRSPFKALYEILDKIKELCNEEIRILEEHIQILNSQKRDPQEFLKELEIRQKGLEKLEVNCYLILEEASINFLGAHSPIEEAINTLKSKYYDLFMSTNSIEELRKYYREAENELTEIVSNNQKNINLFFKTKLEEIGESLTEEYKINIPRIDLQVLEEVSRSKAVKKEEIVKEEVESLLENWNFLKPWKWLKSSRTYKVVVGNKIIFDEMAFFNNLKSSLINDFISTIENLKDEFYKAINYYRNTIKELLNEKRKWLENIKKEIKSFEKIEHEILTLQKRINLIQRELKKIEILQEELKC
ncbi:MAG: dynamin family protein [Minisyncoccia bacterium]